MLVNILPKVAIVLLLTQIFSLAACQHEKSESYRNIKPSVFQRHSLTEIVQKVPE